TDFTRRLTVTMVQDGLTSVRPGNGPDRPTGAPDLDRPSNSAPSRSVLNGAAVLLNGAMMNGALPAAGGLLAGVSTIYTLNKNGGDTVEERLGAARTGLIVIATSPALVKAGSKAV